MLQGQQAGCTIAHGRGRVSGHQTHIGRGQVKAQAQQRLNMYGGQRENRYFTILWFKFLSSRKTHQGIDNGNYQQQKGHIGPIGMKMSRSEEHTSELQSLMRISYAVFCLKKKKKKNKSRTN